MKRTIDNTNWSLDDWLSYLEQQHHKSIDMGLERISQVANALSADKPGKRVITVGGTNGKGSTVRFLEQILLAQGKQVATYTSPHFMHYRERVRINGQELDDAEHCAAFAAVEHARGDISLTYFEFGTLAAFWLIARHQVEFAILEVGLGGRLDAVNVVAPDISIVTSVGIDHIEFLGDNREQIGFEKAGIYRAGAPAICADPTPPASLIAHAHSIHAELIRVGREYDWLLHCDEEGNPVSWQFKRDEWILQQLPLPRLPVMNAAASLAALSTLDERPSLEAIKKGLRQASLPGRLEIFRQQPLIILDVAHNPHAAEYLSEQLRLRWPGYRVRAVCAMLKDKDIVGTLRCLAGTVDAWYCASTPGPRGYSGTSLQQNLYQLLHQQGSSCRAGTEHIHAYESVQNAYESALSDAETGDIVLCFGSFLTIQAIYELEG